MLQSISYVYGIQWSSIIDGISHDSSNDGKDGIVGYIVYFILGGVYVGIVGVLWGIWGFFGVVVFGESLGKSRGS